MPMSVHTKTPESRHDMQTDRLSDEHGGNSTMNKPAVSASSCPGVTGSLTRVRD